MSLWINSHILGASKYLLSVRKYTGCTVSLSLSFWIIFQILWFSKSKVSFIMSGPKSFLSYRSLSKGFVDLCHHLSHQKGEMNFFVYFIKRDSFFLNVVSLIVQRPTMEYLNQKTARELRSYKIIN